jgi:predicted  nucleic acid-binding Zn-ribbon protein
MSNIAGILYTIQTFELAIDEARSRVQAIEVALAHDELVATAQARLEASERALHQSSAQVTDLELEISSLSGKINDVDKLLYSGLITNPKELQERQDELESLKRRYQGLEVRLLEASDALKACQAEYEQATQNLQEAIQVRDQSHIDLIAERQLLDVQITANLKQRKTRMHEVPDEILKQYRRLRKQHKNGQAIALIVDEACSACRIEQPTSEIQRIMRADDLVYCVGCGRILARQ